MRSFMNIGLALGLVSFIGCGGGGGDDPPATPDAAVADAGTMPDGEAAGDHNDSFAQAENVTKNNDMGVSGVIQSLGDHDFFKFSGTAGTWTWIDVEANPDDENEKIDTVITLYNASMTKVAENDDAVPRVNTDSEILIKLPATGDYFLEVQEFSDWAGMTLEGRPDYIYNITVFELDPTMLAAVKEELELNDDAASATEAKLAGEGGSSSGVMLGGFATGDTADLWSFTVQEGQNYFRQAVMPGGVDGYGSTVSVGRAEILDDSLNVIARINPSDGQYAMSPPLPPGTFWLKLEPPAGYAAGANDFWVAKHLAGPGGNDPEAEGPAGGANDTLATAEVLTANENGSAFVIAHLSTESDVDYFQITAQAGNRILVACGSAQEGSGVIGLTAEIKNASDMTIGVATETVQDGIFIEDATASTAGNYYVKLSKTGQDVTVAGDWARCGFHVRP